LSFRGIKIVDVLFLRPGNEEAAKALGMLRKEKEDAVRIVAYCVPSAVK
jgi:hypothetical protein